MHKNPLLLVVTGWQSQLEWISDNWEEVSLICDNCWFIYNYSLSSWRVLRCYRICNGRWFIQRRQICVHLAKKVIIPLPQLPPLKKVMLSKDTRCKALKTLTDCRTKPKFILHKKYHQRAELSCLDDKVHWCRHQIYRHPLISRPGRNLTWPRQLEEKHYNITTWKNFFLGNFLVIFINTGHRFANVVKP